MADNTQAGHVCTAEMWVLPTVNALLFLLPIRGLDTVFRQCSLCSDKIELHGRSQNVGGDNLQPDNPLHYWNVALGKGVDWCDWGSLLVILIWISFWAMDHEARWDSSLGVHGPRFLWAEGIWEFRVCQLLSHCLQFCFSKTMISWGFSSVVE